jgi:hypothetical protein
MPPPALRDAHPAASVFTAVLCGAIPIHPGFRFTSSRLRLLRKLLFEKCITFFDNSVWIAFIIGKSTFLQLY